jgi:hypothetical protein
VNENHQLLAKQHTGDLVHPVVTTPIPVAMTDIRSPIVGRPPASTLIYADTAGCSKFLAAGLSRFGRRSTVVHDDHNVSARLEDVSTFVDAAFVSLQDPSFDISAFFAFLSDRHPRIRRIAFAQHKPRKGGEIPPQFCRHDMILWDPWDRADFVEILKDALNCRDQPARSSWSDTMLFKSNEGRDRLAIAEIIKRYRHRIVSLALDMDRDSADTEDVVQETYLNIVRFLPLFRDSYSPGYWIDHITRRTIQSFSNGEHNFLPPIIKFFPGQLPLTSRA